MVFELAYQVAIVDIAEHAHEDWLLQLHVCLHGRLSLDQLHCTSLRCCDLTCESICQDFVSEG